MFAFRTWAVVLSLMALLTAGCQKSDDWVKKEEHYPDGTLKSTAFVKIVSGREHLVGEAKTFYPSGKTHTVTEFVNGKRHGPFIEYFEDGRIKTQGRYELGRQHGEWSMTDAAGNVSKSTFDKGRKTG